MGQFGSLRWDGSIRARMLLFILPLVVVPVLYTYLDRFAEWRKARRAARAARHAPAAAPAPETAHAD